MKYRYKIFLGFSLFILVSLILLIMNLRFYQKTAHRMQTISQKTFSISLHLQDSSIIVYKIQSDVWNTFLPDSRNKAEKEKELDQYAGKFYQNIRTIRELTQEVGKYQVLIDSFKNYYLFATSLKSELDIRGLDISADALSKFTINRDILNKELQQVTKNTRSEFEQALLTLENDLQRAIIGIIIFGVIFLSLSLLVSWLLAKRLTKPIEYLTEVAGSIARGKYDVRVEYRTSGEIHLLAEAFNNMAEHIHDTLGDLKNTKQELLISHNFLDNVIHSLSSLLISVDKEFRINLINHAAGTYFYLDEQDVAGKIIWEVLPFLENYKTEIYSTIKQQVVWKADKVRLQENNITYLDISVFPLRDKQSDGLVIVMDDVTKSIKKDDQIRQMQKMETLGVLAGGLAHDFNNILTVILNSNALIGMLLNSDTIQKDQIQEMVSMTESTVNKATDLVKNLLSLTRKQELKFEYCDLNEIILEISKMCLRTFDKSVVIDTIEYPEKASFYGDSNQLGHVLLNLCINAWHAMTIMKDPDDKPGGKLRLELSRTEVFPAFLKTHPQAHHEQYWVINIEDNGVGMNEETITRIFDPFFTTKDTAQGTGLGLAMVYNIIQLHHGFIDVSSEPGLGTIFKIYLPLNMAIQEQVEEPQKEITHGQGTILLIDDEEMVRETLGQILNVLGYKIELAPDGWEGISIYKKKKKELSLIILDLSMPGLSGYDTFYQLQEISKQIPILIHSGFRDEDKVEKLLKDGAAGFLQKPYTLYELSDQLKNILNKP